MVMFNIAVPLALALASPLSALALLPPPPAALAREDPFDAAVDDLDHYMDQASPECVDAIDGMYDAYGKFGFGGDKEAGRKLPSLVDACIKECPGFKAQCEVYKGIGGADSDDCHVASNAMYAAYGNFTFGGDKEAGSKLPSLVDACIKQCPDKRADCEVYKGVGAYSDECLDALSKIYQGFGEYHHAEKGHKKTVEAKLPGLADACIKACPVEEDQYIKKECDLSPLTAGLFDAMGPIADVPVSDMLDAAVAPAGVAVDPLTSEAVAPIQGLAVEAGSRELSDPSAVPITTASTVGEISTSVSVRGAMIALAVAGAAAFF